MAKNNETTSPELEDAMTPEEKQEYLRRNEGDILSGLLEAAGYKDCEDETYPVEIIRGGRVLFSFRIRPLSELEYSKCREKHTKYTRNRAMGNVRVVDKADATGYRSELIYQATVPEDREKVWNNQAAWKALNVVTGIDLIDKVLKAGEKDRLCDRVDEISGYGAEEIKADSEVESAKN